MSRGPDFFKQMSPEQVEALEEYARQPGRTGKECLTWLTEQGVKTSERAVYRWREDFKVWDDSVRRGEFARSLIDAKNTDPDAVHEATLQLLDAAVLDKLVSGEPLTPKDLKELAATRGLSSKERAELRRVRAENEAAKRAMTQLSGEAKKRVITPEDIESVSKAVFG